MRTACFGTALVALVFLPLVALGDSERSTEEIAVCMARNVPLGDELRSVTLVTRDRAGESRTTRADVFGRRTSDGRRTLVSFREPADLEGSGLLLIERGGVSETWLHTPELGRRRLNSGAEYSQSLFGTGMSFEDLIHLLGFVRTEASRLERGVDETLEGRTVHVLRNKPLPGTSSYSRIVSRVDQQSCLPLEVRFFTGEADAPRKTLSTDPEQIFRVGRIWIAHSAVLRELRDGKRTAMHLESVMPGLKLPDLAFDPDQLGNYKPSVALEVRFEPIKAPKPVLLPPE